MNIVVRIYVYLRGERTIGTLACVYNTGSAFSNVGYEIVRNYTM